MRYLIRAIILDFDSRDGGSNPSTSSNQLMEAIRISKETYYQERKIGNDMVKLEVTDILFKTSDGNFLVKQEVKYPDTKSPLPFDYFIDKRWVDKISQFGVNGSITHL